MLNVKIREQKVIYCLICLLHLTSYNTSSVYYIFSTYGERLKYVPATAVSENGQANFWSPNKCIMNAMRCFYWLFYSQKDVNFAENFRGNSRRYFQQNLISQSLNREELKSPKTKCLIMFLLSAVVFLLHSVLSQTPT